MNYSSLISWIGAGLSLGLAAWVWARDRHSLVHKIFIAGMLALAAEAVLTGIGFRAMTPTEAVTSQRIRLVVTGLIPGTWLFFTAIYGRINSAEVLKKFGWVILSAFVLPLALTTVFSGAFFTGEPVQLTSISWVIRLGWSGYAFYLLLLVCLVVVLMNLEKILRGSAGYIRWQVKFMVIGLGGLFALRLYTYSQNILYHFLDTKLELVNSVALIVANALVLKALLRTRKLSVDFYLSHSLLYNSFTLFIVGACFLAVGVLAEGLKHLKGVNLDYLDAFLVFLAITAISVLFLSDRLRNRVKRFISVHFKRPLYDYRKEWEEFVQATTCQTEVRDLCAAIVKKVSKTFETLSVTIWLADEREKNLRLGASTAFTDIQTRNVTLWNNAAADFAGAMRSQETLVDFDHPGENWALDFKEKTRIT